MNEHRNKQSTKKPRVHDEHKISVDLAENTSLADILVNPSADSLHKNNGRRWLFVIIGFVLLLVLINGIVALTSKPKTTPMNFLSVTDVLDGVKPNLDGKALTPTVTNSLGGQTADGYAVYTLPVARVADNQYKTVPSDGQGFGLVSNKTVSAHNYELLTDYFTQIRFAPVESQEGSGMPVFLSRQYATKTTSYDVFESSDVRCAIWLLDISSVQVGNEITGVGCANKSDYKKVADAAKPFAEAYGTDDTIAGRIFGVPTITDGRDGYKNATIYQEIAYKSGQVDSDFDSVNGLYFMQPNGAWTLFHLAVGGSTPECSSFDTDTLMKSFAGTTCITATQKETKV